MAAAAVARGSSVAGRRRARRRLERRQAEPLSCVFQHLDGAGRAAARHPERADLEQSVERPDAAGGLDLHRGRRVRAHQPQVLVGGAGGRVPGGRLDPVGAELAADLTEADLVLVLQVGVLEDDLHLLARGVGHVDDGGDVVADGPPVAAQHLADVDDHVELLAAVLQGAGRLRPP